MKSISKKKRIGAATVEFAMVAPIFILLVFGMIEFGRAVMVQQVLVNASREGARQAVLDGSTGQDVVDRVSVYLDTAGIDDETLIYSINGTEVSVSNSTEIADVAGFGDAVGVEIRVNFDDVSWMPVPHYIGGTVLRAGSVMRRETSQ